jgi:hypothetical protein
MPPIGERLTDVRTSPRISPEQQELIERWEIELGKRIDAMAPPIHDYMVYPLFYTDDLTLTVSGCATYDVANKTIAALVTRDCNNDVKLRTMLYNDLPEGATPLTDYVEAEKGIVVEVSSRQYDRGRLHYLSEGRHYAVRLETFEQHMDALSNINETLDLIAEANLSTYGVSSFEGADRDELVAIRQRAEPGLIDFVEESFQAYMAYRDRVEALK